MFNYFFNPITIFRDLKGKKTVENFRDKILDILRIWEKWHFLESSYLNGLKNSFLNKKRQFDSIPIDIPQNIKILLENYEDKLLEIYSNNEEELREIAMKKGISCKGEASVTISKLLSLKENELLEENKKVK